MELASYLFLSEHKEVLSPHTPTEAGCSSDLGSLRFMSVAAAVVKAVWFWSCTLMWPCTFFSYWRLTLIVSGSPYHFFFSHKAYAFWE